MSRKRLYFTEEEKSAAGRAKHLRWLEKPGSVEKQYLANQKTQSERHRRWRQNHKDQTRLKSANERAVRLQRIPPWADMETIKEFYLNCPEGYHVDHDIPLRGKLVSGLHVRENLQYLTKLENLRKSSSFDIE